MSTRNDILRLATLNAVMRPSNSEEFYLASSILNKLFHMTVDQTIEKYEAENNQQAWDGASEAATGLPGPTEEEVRIRPILQPIQITGPGWYRTASNQKVHITGWHEKMQLWHGTID